MPILLERKIKALNHFLAGGFLEATTKKVSNNTGKRFQISFTFFFEASDLFTAPEGLKGSGMFSNTMLTLYPLRPRHSIYATYLILINTIHGPDYSPCSLSCLEATGFHSITIPGTILGGFAFMLIDSNTLG